MYVWLCMYSMYSMVMAYDIVIYDIEFIAWMCCLYVAKLYVLSCKNRMNISLSFVVMLNVSQFTTRMSMIFVIMHVCMYVCFLQVCMYVCPSGCMYACLSVYISSAYPCVWLSMRAYTLLRTCKYTHTCLSIHLSACMSMHGACMCGYARACVYVCTSPHLSVCMYAMYARYITILYEIFICILECIAKHTQDMDVLFAFCKWTMVNSSLEVWQCGVIVHFVHLILGARTRCFVSSNGRNCLSQAESNTPHGYLPNNTRAHRKYKLTHRAFVQITGTAELGQT